MSTGGDDILPAATGQAEGCALLVVGADDTVLSCTAAAAALIGEPASALTGRTAGELFDDPAVWPRLRTREPETCPVSENAVLKGRQESVLCALLPVEGRGDARGLLRLVPAGTVARREQDEALMRALTSQSGIGLAIHDEELRVLRINPLPEDLQRLVDAGGDGSAIGRRLHELLVPHDAAVIETQLRRVAGTGVPLVDFVTPARLVQAPHSDRTISLSALRLTGEAGAVHGVAVTFTDVTEEERAQRRSALVATAASALGRSLETGRNAQVLADLLVPAFADLASVDITETVLVGEEPGEFAPGAPLRRVAAAASDGVWPAELYQQGEILRVRGYESERLRLGSAVIVADLDTLRPRIADDPDRVRLLLADRAASLMVVPLQARGQVLGAVGLWRAGDRAPFDALDASVAEDIASRAGLAIDNARRYTRERRTAESLQRSLLPRPVLKLTAAETAGIYVPGRTVAGTGGSWFDVITLSSARVAFVVGTVRGHGLGAAAAMGSLRTAVRTLSDLDPPPDELLTHLDDLVVRLAEDEPPGDSEGSVRGATCLYAVYDPVTAHCLVASAGHAPPLLAGASGGTDSVDVPAGPALGLGGAPFEPVELALGQGDLLAFTAGSLSARETDGTVRVAEHLRRASADGSRPVAEIGRTVLVPFLADPPDDDAALLLARLAVTPPESVASWEFPADGKVVAEARAQVADRLAAWGLEALAFTTELIVSELVTNAIRYAGGPVGVRLIRDRRLVVEVSDPSQTQPHLRRARLTDEGGRGLFLIAQLTHRWGSRYTAHGKTIWTEQQLPPADA
ncbi:SpoIIE family protein phosphatase [Streptomyces genisteinicus]|uniref:SpoIIE family protein phosphatase n=1 Tax=Streptomyces genisteinicus TaxID=2768068 RepID=A0A7H0HN63_9ACTN|nr:SpoIIE family protein phosphatase [Streptomyces genisteinicus]QNP61979.1 SpoIIE family protein phosphatase [Streptomyces genisteinicus]